MHREGAHFVQHLEGPGAAVDDLMARIARDRRHGDLRVLPCGEASGRLFAGWSMGFTDARWLTLADTFRCRPARLVHEPAETALRFLSRAAEVAARPGARSASARWRGGRAAGLS